MGEGGQGRILAEPQRITKLRLKKIGFIYEGMWHEE